jgi:hypothetical protein
VLGRVTTVAEARRDAGNGQLLFPITRMLLNAHRGLIQQIEYHNGAAAIPADGSVATPSTPRLPRRRRRPW